MADNEHTIVGVTKVVCVVKPPASPPAKAEDARLFTQLTVIGSHQGSPIALVPHDLVPRLRKLGAEVTVIDNDGNHYAGRVLAAPGPDDLVASVEESVTKGKADFAIAQSGGGGTKNGK